MNTIVNQEDMVGNIYAYNVNHKESVDQQITQNWI